MRRGLLAQPDFRLLLAGRFCTSVAAQMVTVAVGWQIYALTRDPLHLGLVGLSQFLPFVLLILPAGYVADHLDRRRIMMGCYALQGSAALALLTFDLAGLRSIGPVFAILVLLGVARAFAMPTSQALLPNVVPPEHFNRALALNSSSMHVATVLGPVLGGALFVLHPRLVYGSSAVLLCASLAMMSGIRLGGFTPRARGPIDPAVLLSGLRFVWSRPIMLGAISLDLFAVLFGGATALLPVFASDLLAAGPIGLGLLRTSPAAGAALCALVLVFVPITRHAGAWMLGSVAAFGLCTIGFGLSRSLPLSLLLLLLLGASDMVSVYIRHLLVQLETPDEIRGRVSAVSAVFIGASNELGEFESGVTAAWWGVVPAVVAGGAASILVAGLWARLFPSLARLDRLPKALGSQQAV